MTWTINASGHTPAPEGSDGREDVERKLHAELAEVLAKPEYGCTWSTFGGNHVSGTIHEHHSEDTEHVHETDPED